MGAKNIKWKKLGFEYVQTSCHIRYHYKNGRWDKGILIDSPFINLHISATSLHYGQQCFEGLKAFSTRQNKIAVFRPLENAKRLIQSAERLQMPYPSEKMFLQAISRVIKANADYMPPYGTGASLYIRPLLIGTGPILGVKPSREYDFIVFVSPVGPYYKEGIKPVPALVIEEYDRTAPKGVGNIKAGGNYAASLLPHKIANNKNFPIVLYLDSKTHKYIDEFGTSNFIGITKKGDYLTPRSCSILKSITNTSLMQIARDYGMKVDQRPIRFDELSNFKEVGACGTAAVITAIHSITRQQKTIKFGQPNKPGTTLKKLYDTIISIQHGDLPDKYCWMKIID
ncbi:MAG: branched-chain amino acid aminotransferase [bacterium]